MPAPIEKHFVHPETQIGQQSHLLPAMFPTIQIGIAPVPAAFRTPPVVLRFARARELFYSIFMKKRFYFFG
jgi:hypothetical protein